MIKWSYEPAALSTKIDRCSRSEGEALRGFVRLPAMFRYRLDQHSDQRRGKIMAHAFDHHEFGAWYVSGGILAAFGQGQWIFCSMNDEGRPADALEDLHPATVRQDGDELARHAGVIVRSVVPLGNFGAQLLVGGGQARAADGALAFDAMYEIRLAVLSRRRRDGQHGQGFGLALRQVRVAAARHDRDKTCNALRIIRGDDLADHAAHRRADNMRLIDLQCVEKADRILR